MGYRDYNSSDTKLVSVRLRLDLFDKIDKIADETSRTRSAVVNMLLAKALGLESTSRIESLEKEVEILACELKALRSEVNSIRSNLMQATNIDDL